MIVTLRDQRVMLDAELATLYGVETKVLEQAIKRNIEIMRAFVQVRSTAATHQELVHRLGELEAKTDTLAMQHDVFSRITRVQLKQAFDALRELMTPPDPPKRPIWFITPEDKPKGSPAARGKKT